MAMALEAVLEPLWYTISSPTHYVTSNPSNLSFTQPYRGCIHLMIGSGKHLSISHIISN